MFQWPSFTLGRHYHMKCFMMIRTAHWPYLALLLIHVRSELPHSCCMPQLLIMRRLQISGQSPLFGREQSSTVVHHAIDPVQSTECSARIANPEHSNQNMPGIAMLLSSDGASG